ncbi:MAG: divergent polysaccharide deacetylase family protein [Pseudomonadota bacterium]
MADPFSLARRLVGTLVLAGLLCSSQVRADTAYVAIILDDMGHNEARGQRALALPANVTYAFLPYAPFAAQLAERAHLARREVMVHMPMANLSDQPIGPRGLVPELGRDDFLARVDEAMARVPFASGINNHMGSYLTQQTREMQWLMADLKRRNLFFVDSRTTPATVASRVARSSLVSSSSRDIFLDNERNADAIDSAFQLLIQRAKHKGTALAIGHPHEETISYLEVTLPLLRKQGIKVIPVSHLIALQRLQELQLANRVFAD